MPISDEKPDLIPELHEFIRVRDSRKLPPLTPAELEVIDKQIAAVELQRDQRRERRLQDMPHETERREGFDRRQRADEPKDQ